MGFDAACIQIIPPIEGKLFNRTLSIDPFLMFLNLTWYKIKKSLLRRCFALEQHLEYGQINLDLMLLTWSIIELWANMHYSTWKSGIRTVRKCNTIGFWTCNSHVRCNSIVSSDVKPKICFFYRRMCYLHWNGCIVLECRPNFIWFSAFNLKPIAPVL